VWADLSDLDPDLVNTEERFSSLSANKPRCVLHVVVRTFPLPDCCQGTGHDEQYKVVFVAALS
jgi:hypothetical protein